MFTTNSWPLSHAWLHCLLPPYRFPAIWLFSSPCFTLIPHCLFSFYPSHLICVLSPLSFSSARHSLLSLGSTVNQCLFQCSLYCSVCVLNLTVLFSLPQLIHSLFSPSSLSVSVLFSPISFVTSPLPLILCLQEMAFHCTGWIKQHPALDCLSTICLFLSSVPQLK